MFASAQFPQRSPQVSSHFGMVPSMGFPQQQGFGQSHQQASGFPQQQGFGQSHQQAAIAAQQLFAQGGAMRSGYQAGFATQAPGGAAIRTQQAPAPVPEPDLDKTNEEWLSVPAQQRRRDALQLSDPKVSAFIEDCEFVSLGSFCGVSRALQCVGIKKFSYPFDWVRTPLEGVLHLFENKFEDFLSYSFKTNDAGLTGYGGSKWGGSFWHHDPESAKTKADMGRRVSRLFGKAEVPASRTRVFVYACNSSSELELCVKLRRTLCQALPEAKVYLLIMMDAQTRAGPLVLSDEEGMIIWRIHESNHPMENGTGKWGSTGPWTMKKQAEAYAQGLGFAIKLWSGDKASFSHVQLVPDLMSLCQVCDAYGGTDPTREFWCPKDAPKPPLASFSNSSQPRPMLQNISSKSNAQDALKSSTADNIQRQYLKTYQPKTMSADNVPSDLRTPRSKVIQRPVWDKQPSTAFEKQNSPPGSAASTEASTPPRSTIVDAVKENFREPPRSTIVDDIVELPSVLLNTVANMFYSSPWDLTAATPVNAQKKESNFAKSLSFGNPQARISMAENITLGREPSLAHMQRLPASASFAQHQQSQSPAQRLDLATKNVQQLRGKLVTTI